ncbi:MAG: M48 family metalloprotease [Pirellulales bacterium]|nr:M48 family metalloprotease [Pirellulales bacterium]
MAIAVACKHCRAAFQVKDEWAGRRGKCPRCGQTIDVPPAPPPSVGTGRVADTTSPAACAPATPTPTATSSAPPTNTPPPAAASTPLPTAQQILDGLSEPLPRVDLALGYRLAILLVGAVMVLLPVVYVGLIGLVVYAVAYHAANDVGILGMVRGRAAIVPLVLYAGPIVIGAVMVLFMVKPLFARDARSMRTRSITPKSDPLLFAFVARLCAVVGAPMPKRIDVDCDVNASASFRRGFWSMFGGGDLVLTIGLPLVAGLSLREFAGVLAHEFGHFSQGAGMRLTYVIRAVSIWFTRVVYQRDAWDVHLEDWARESDFRLAIVLHAARLGVWLTRRILWCLMLAGHAVSGILLRQMEFDADRQETRLAGSDAFESTNKRIHVLGVAAQGAQADLGYFYREGRLGDNLPRLILANVDQIPSEVMAQLTKYLEEATAGLFDTHPSPAQRVAKARRENAPGIFRIEGPATALFGDFDDLARQATWDYYRSIFGPRFKPSDMHPVDDLLARQGRDKKDAEALERYFLGPLPLFRPLPLPQKTAGPPAGAKEAVDRLRAARGRMLAMKEEYARSFAEFDKADKRVAEAVSARAVLESWLAWSGPGGAAAIQSPQEAAKIHDDAAGAIERLAPQLAPFERAFGERLHAALSLLFVPRVAGRIKDAPAWQTECGELLPILSMLEEELPQTVRLRNEFLALRALVSKLDENRDNEKLIRRIERHMAGTRQHLAILRQAVLRVPYPFDHVDKDITVAAYAVSEMPNEDDLGGLYTAAESMISASLDLRARILARLTFFAEQVESVLGLPGGAGRDRNSP